MKNFIVDTGDKKYKVEANTYDEAISAVKAVQAKKAIKDAYVYRIKNSKGEYEAIKTLTRIEIGTIIEWKNDKWTVTNFLRNDAITDEASPLQKDLAHAMQFADSKVKDDIDAVRIIGIRYNKYVVMDKTATKVLSPKFDDVDDAYNWIKKNYPRAKVLDSKIKDEANLPTTIQALVNDEEAAIKAYEVAIKNLEGKIDETQMQVLINIMKDERKHVENLYAILNGQVTEKNLEDSRVRDDIEDKVDDILDRLNIDYGGDVYSGIELRKGSREERLFLNELNKAHIRYTESEDTHSGRGYVGYYDFR